MKFDSTVGAESSLYFYWITWYFAILSKYLLNSCHIILTAFELSVLWCRQLLASMLIAFRNRIGSG